MGLVLVRMVRKEGGHEVEQVGDRQRVPVAGPDDDGKIVEHWDVLQVIPETSANDNGMF